MGGSRQVRRVRQNELMRRQLPAASEGSGSGQLPRARGPSDELSPDWTGVRGRAGSLGRARVGSSLGTSHLLPGGPMAPSAPRNYKG
jgi:hypothetical protein